MPFDRRLPDAAFTALTWVVGLGAVALPLGIIGFLIVEGGSVLDLAFLSSAPKGAPLGSAGGIGPALLGSVALVGVGTAIAAPLGIGAALFLAEYGRGARGTGLARFAIECLAATPSIVYGLVGYALLVVGAQLGVSLAAGAMTLAAVMTPIVVIGSHAALQAVDPAEREAGLSLGVTRWHVLRRIVLPRAWAGIVGAVVLAAAHAFGSAAPVLFTASVVHARGDLGLRTPVMTLPTHLYYLVSEATSFRHAYGTALVLVVLLLAGNALGMLLARRGAMR